MYSTSRDQVDPEEHDRDHDGLEGEPDPPGEVRRQEPAEEGTDRRRDGRRRPDQRVDAHLLLALEVAVDERLHGRHEQRRTEATQHGPEDDDGEQVLGEHHRDRAGGVAEQAEHVRALATEEVAELAADEDERSRHEGFEGDRRLHAADRRVEVLHHGGDRHVHERRVEDEHEHRQRQEEAETPAPLRFVGARG